MEAFFKEIKEKIKEAVIEVFPKITKELGEEKPYTVAFVTDSDYVTLWLGVNSYEHLKKTDAKYGKDGDSATTKWDPDEWGYSDGDSQLVMVSDELSDKMESVIDHINSQTDNLSFSQLCKLVEDSGFPRLFIETVTSAFQELIQLNVFGFNPDEVTFFISMSDDKRAYDIENNSAKTLNSKKVYEEFLKRKSSYKV